MGQPAASQWSKSRRGHLTRLPRRTGRGMWPRSDKRRMCLGEQPRSAATARTSRSWTADASVGRERLIVIFKVSRQ
jgi:hypothetical protein